MHSSRLWEVSVLKVLVEEYLDGSKREGRRKEQGGGPSGQQGGRLLSHF